MLLRVGILIGLAVVAVADQDPPFACTRATPHKAILAPAKGQAKATFVLRKNPDAGNSVEAVERWQMDDSTRVQVFQSGCSDFSDAYTFTVSGDAHAISERAYWFSKGASLLQSLPVKQDMRDEIAEMVRALHSMTRHPNAYRDGRKEVVKGYEFVGLVVKPVGTKKQITIDYEIDL